MRSGGFSRVLEKSLGNVAFLSLILLDRIMLRFTQKIIGKIRSPKSLQTAPSPPHLWLFLESRRRTELSYYYFLGSVFKITVLYRVPCRPPVFGVR